MFRCGRRTGSHLTPGVLEELATNIRETKDLNPFDFTISSLSDWKLQLPQFTSLQPPKIHTVKTKQPLTSAEPPSSNYTTIMVKGFSLAHVSSSFRSIPAPGAPSSISNLTIAAAPSTLIERMQEPPKMQTSARKAGTKNIQQDQPLDDDVFNTYEDDINDSAIDGSDDFNGWKDSNRERSPDIIDESFPRAHFGPVVWCSSIRGIHELD